MKTFLFLLLISIFSSIASAQLKDSTSDLDQAFSLIQKHQCGLALKVQQNQLLNVFFKQSQGERRRYFMQIFDLKDQNQNRVLASDFPIVDVVADEQNFYLLSNQVILVADKHSGSAIKSMYYTSKASGQTKLRMGEIATAIDVWGDLLVISHGRHGIAAVNKHTGELVFEHVLAFKKPNKQSMATGLQVVGDVAVLSMDNYTLVDPKDEQAFRGLVVFDLKQQKVLRELEVLSPGSESLQIVGEHIYVSFNPAIWKFKLSEVLGNTPARRLSVQRAWRYPDPRYGYGKGKNLFTQDKMYSCFSQTDDMQEFYLTPRSFELKELNWPK